MVAKRGRPSKTNDTISINDLTVDVLANEKRNHTKSEGQVCELQR